MPAYWDGESQITQKAEEFLLGLLLLGVHSRLYLKGQRAFQEQWHGPRCAICFVFMGPTKSCIMALSASDILPLKTGPTFSSNYSTKAREKVSLLRDFLGLSEIKS